MSKILVIDESPLFRGYLSQKLETYGFEMVQGANGLDGWIKMRNEMPDLVIMDYYLSRKSSLELLQEKNNNRNTKDIPIIMVSSKIDKRNVVQLAEFNVKKIFSKPIRMEKFLDGVSSILNVEIAVDDTPCVIEAHFNEDILFIEIAQGLNIEKIEQLRYKIAELFELYQVNNPKILLMMSSLDLPEEHQGKLKILFDTVMDHAQPNGKMIKILTTNEAVIKLTEKTSKYNAIQVHKSLDTAMDSLLGLKADKIAHDEVVSERLLKSSAPKKEKGEAIQMRFDSGETEQEDQQRASVFHSEARVAVVDDDMVIQELVKTVFSDTEWKLTTFNNGKEFMENPEGPGAFDLIFLDLMMPEMNGFQVLELLKKKSIEVPVIVFSALSQKETVVKAVGFGVNTYLIKPLKPEQLLRKAAEVLSVSF
jgi:DNA-binding response OmpR family regulator